MPNEPRVTSRRVYNTLHYFVVIIELLWWQMSLDSGRSLMLVSPRRRIISSEPSRIVKHKRKVTLLHVPLKGITVLSRVLSLWIYYRINRNLPCTISNLNVVYRAINIGIFASENRSFFLAEFYSQRQQDWNEEEKESKRAEFKCRVCVVEFHLSVEESLVSHKRVNLQPQTRIICVAPAASNGIDS